MQELVTLGHIETDIPTKRTGRSLCVKAVCRPSQIGHPEITDSSAGDRDYGKWMNQMVNPLGDTPYEGPEFKAGDIERAFAENRVCMAVLIERRLGGCHAYGMGMKGPATNARMARMLVERYPNFRDIQGFEGLARIVDYSQRNPIATPGFFMQEMLRYRVFMEKLFEASLLQTCQIGQQMRKLGDGKHVPLGCVNLVPEALETGRFQEIVKRNVAAAQSGTQHLAFEVMEHTDPDVLKQHINDMKWFVDSGGKLLIDDAPAEHSLPLLELLQKNGISVAGMKIDGRLVNGAAKDPAQVHSIQYFIDRAAEHKIPKVILEGAPGITVADVQTVYEAICDRACVNRIDLQFQGCAAGNGTTQGYRTDAVHNGKAGKKLIEMK